MMSVTYEENLENIKYVLSRGKLFIVVRHRDTGEEGIMTCSSLRRVIIIDPHDPLFSYYILGLIYSDHVREHVGKTFKYYIFSSLEALAKEWVFVA